MAWIDDRVWCHPKFTELSSGAGWAWTKGIAYSAGFGTGGTLEPGQLRTIGATSKTVRELVAAGLWEPLEGGSILIHDWDDHNAKRDERRARDRERKRAAYKTGKNGGVSAGENAEKTAEKRAEKRAEPRAVTEVKEVTEVKNNPKAVTEASYERPQGCTIASISDAAMLRAVEIAAAAGATA